MSPSSHAPRPTPARESELARAESELSTQEARLAEQVSRASAEAQALASRLAQVCQQLSQAQSEHAEDVALPELGARLREAAVPELAVEEAREQALEAREQALEARRQASQEIHRALAAFQRHSGALARELSEAEAHLQQLTESAARSRREQEAARTRKAQQARAEASRPTAPARPPSRPALPPAPPGLSSRRERERVRLQASIHLGSDSNFFTGFSTDISTGGLFVATVETVPRGTQVELDFTLPGGRPLKARGVVRWLREPNEHTPELMPGMGVQFQELPPEVASAISDFVRKREPLFFPD